MSEPVPSSPEGRFMTDPWETGGPIVLDGLLERNRFEPGLTAVIALIVGFLAYQLIGTVAILVLLVANGVGLEQIAQDLPTLFEEQAAAMISANSIGLLLGLGVLAFLLTRLHTRQRAAFLRLRKPDGVALLLGVVGLFVLMPVVQWAGNINQSLPLPEAVRAFEETQMELIEKILLGDFGIVFSLLMLAVTPALCEELFFRGYIQRHFERAAGAVGGIMLTGVIFGAYHLRLTQVLPLSLLGIYLAFLAWQTGSLWVPIVVHFANNAFAVAAAEVVKSRSDLGLADLEHIAIPWYIVLLGLLLFGGVLYLLQRWTQTLLARQQVASPV